MSIERMISRGVLLFKKQIPNIFMAIGIATGVLSTIFACKATLEAQEIIEQHKIEIEDVRSLKECSEPEEYRDLVVDTYKCTAIELLKLYFPAILLGATSIASVLGGYNIVKKRYAGVLAAYSGLQKSFKKYREHATLGKDPDPNPRYSTVDGGPIKVEKGEVTHSATVMVSQYSRFFDSTSEYWVNDAEQNLLFLREAQRRLNDRLQKRGYVFLNEVYEELGFEPSTEGALVGWVLNEGGSNFIDFNLYNVHVDDPAKRMFVNGIERVVLLDFNVDGVIYDLI